MSNLKMAATGQSFKAVFLDAFAAVVDGVGWAVNKRGGRGFSDQLLRWIA
ncbi:hypothetical protein [Yoonia sp. MH D7]